MPRVLVTPKRLIHVGGPYRDVLDEAGFEVIYPQPEWRLDDPKVLAARLEKIDAVLAGMEPFTDAVFDAAQLRVVARMGVGYDAIDVAAASRHGVAVTITPGTNEDSVAEHTVALLLGVMRGFPARDHEARSGTWRRKPLPRLKGKTLGLVGLGRIGRAVVPRAQGLGVEVIANDPMADADWAASHGVELCSFHELLAHADAVSLHLPCTPETTNLINAGTLAMMQPGSVLINTARGRLVDEDALYDALSSGHLFAAGLDVFKVEPLPADNPLSGLENVLLAPHMGGLDCESEVAMSRLAAQCVVDLRAGLWPEGCVVNEEIRPDWTW